mmetsp:Transcript_94965/g.183095  ORF Transcript_94965/g.183095 Transcript_94965/m.183095 type:complete len:87 (-) Transcript_94965:194-454(-)
MQTDWPRTPTNRPTSHNWQEVDPDAAEKLPASHCSQPAKPGLLLKLPGRQREQVVELLVRFEYQPAWHTPHADCPGWLVKWPEEQA